jgi:hypothetical protein
MNSKEILSKDSFTSAHITQTHYTIWWMIYSNSILPR